MLTNDDPWMRFFLSVALELTLVFGLAALLAARLRSATRQRAIWRFGFIAAAALLAVEMSGLGHSTLQSLRTALPAVKRSSPPAFTFTISDPAIPAASRAPAFPGAVPFALAPVSESKGLIWWPALIPLAGILWLAGRRLLAAISLARLGGKHESDIPELAARVQTIAARLGIRRRVRLREMPRLAGPMAFGIFRPEVSVPADFATRHSTTQQNAMLAHELAHVAAFDALWILAADLVAAFAWWHPLAWWAGRRLRAASEAAADEASLLVDSGPAALAECLVALGARLTRTTAFGGLGMAEHRFRSELGRRVERLLALREGDWRPWRGVTAWLARAFGPVAMIALALTAAAWALPRNARAASLAEAFHRSPLGFAATALLASDENDVPRLLIRGKKLLDAGRTNEAEVSWRAALELDPGNKVALGFLASVGRTNVTSSTPAAHSAATPVATPLARTNRVATSKARQRVHEKLDSLRLGTLQFDEVPIEQVLDVLHQEMKRTDPERRGINFVVSPYTPDVPAFDPATGLPSANDPGPSGAVVRIVPAIRGVTLRQALDAIVRGTSPPQRYSVEDWGVLIVDARTVPAVPLHTRWFKIDPNTVAANMSSTFPVAGSRTNRAIESIADSLTENSGKLDLTLAAIRRHFELAGVDLQPPKSVVFNDRLGLLMVRATLQDLDLIEQAVQVLNMAPPQVMIDVKICEVPEDSVKALGFEWLLGSAPTRLPAVVTNPPAAAPSGNRLRDRATNSSLSGVTGILTPQQYAVVLRALEQREDVTFIASPRVLTPSGRQAQLKTVEVRTIVTGLDLSTNLPPEPGQPPAHPPISEPFELGPVVDVVPFVTADGYAIQMTVIPTIKEFVGYDLNSAEVFAKQMWDYVESSGASPAPRRPHVPQPIPLPVFRLRQMVSSATVWDGQTLVLFTRSAKFAVPDNHPVLGLSSDLFDQITTRFMAAKKVEQKAMLVFVTPRIVDPAGNLVHTDEEIPARTNSVPPQPPR